mmetsp:Transcript_48014/g.133976  ORF Transcript_48014/g.133976 Transcript_48014/m.133976 type:complete len:241 (+) Transcript_48014:1398-2120(+)
MELRDVRAHERRRARGVDRHTRALQVHYIREAVRCDTIRGTSRGVRARYVEHATGTHGHPIVLIYAHEMTNILRLALQRLLVPSPFRQRDIGYLQDLALHRVHTFSFGRRYLEELGIEEFDPVNAEAPVFRVSAAELVLGIVIHAVVPPRERDFRQPVRGCLSYACPELVPSVSRSAIAAVHAMDGDVVPGGRRWAAPLHPEQLHVSFDIAQGVCRGLAEVECLQNEPVARGRVRVIVLA